MSLDTLIDQLEKSIDSQYYFLALTTALSVPDISAAIGSDDGRATKKKYIAWYDDWVLPRFSINKRKRLQTVGIESPVDIKNPFTGAECYYYRCAMLHQARSTNAYSAFSRVLFVEPKSTSVWMHYNTINDALLIDLPSFCHEVTQGYRDWIAAVQENDNFRKNMASTMQRHREGLAPYIIGVPVIS
ncbi:hypothetical protein MWU52_12725 [Jannaschia sp. S6380]|uniref:hypothetical protein n=1 Tax=Jannaschia sp. S6380 TaxID=2926408 RepID=UPI001FF51226|nr:hypothetical protein [Jannaschia sp. S6380]MCK0168421.1 hypothetical protein [Jannaschia sp. S6380]